MMSFRSGISSHERTLCLTPKGSEARLVDCLSSAVVPLGVYKLAAQRGDLYGDCLIGDTVSSYV